MWNILFLELVIDATSISLTIRVFDTKIKENHNETRDTMRDTRIKGNYHI